MPTELELLARQIRADARAAAERQAADAARGEALASQFMAAKRIPESLQRAEALAAVAAAIAKPVIVPVATDEDSNEEPGQEEEVDTCTCAACGDDEPSEDMVRVIDHNGDEAYATESCLNNGYDYRQVEHMTRDEARRGIDWYHVDNCVSDDDGEYATNDYAQNYWYWSEHAEQWYQSYVQSPEYREESGDIYDSDADVIDVHGWPSVTPRSALCFGVELEFECDSVSDVAERLGGRDGNDGKYLLKSDGSLDNGIELVTGPYTLEYHQARFGWRDVTRSIGDGGSGFHTGTAGMHIHINRAAMSPLTLGKLLVFINDKANLRMVEGIAQRTANHWAQFHPKKITDGRAQYGDDKYQSLNVRGRTVEMRIFKSNLNPRRIVKNIEFAHAAVTYCAQASMQELGWQSFWDWLRKPTNRKTYGNLIDYGHMLMRDELSTDTSEDI